MGECYKVKNTANFKRKFKELQTQNENQSQFFRISLEKLLNLYQNEWTLNSNAKNYSFKNFFVQKVKKRSRITF